MSSFSVRYRSEIGDAIRRSCLNDLNIPFEEILSATDNFAAENLIELGSSKFCRGKLLQSEKIIDILVGEIHEEDMMMLFLLQHENISTILYCTTNNDYRNILFIKKIEVNGSLAENLSAGSTLSWTQRLSICIGVAKALKYIHSSDFLVPGYHVIHGNIKSSEILLDDNWQPKLQGFESAIVAERNTVHVTSTYKGTLQYMDPTYEKTGALTDKSDVFSFGVVLFEVLFGRETTATPTEAQQDDWNFAEFARLHWKNKTLKKMIDPNMWNNMDSKSVEIFSNVAYACLTEQREKRPNMDQVVRELEESFRLQKNHENSSMVSKTSCSHLQEKSFEHLKISLKDILSATEEFDSKYKIGSGGFATVYKAELEHFVSKNSSAIEEGDASDMHKISNTVAIKVISSTANGFGEKGFIAEVQMLSKCKHPNVVSLLGFCDESTQKILIYEYVPNGSLDSYLERSYRMTDLTWGRRIQICLDIAHGLDYLHSGLNGNEIIIHRDIKSANILLDDNLRAKIADFGLSRLSTINSKNSTINTDNIAGTDFYLDPAYQKTGNLKKASDIYSFGVVLFEILCGTLAYDKIYTSGTDKGLPSIARRLFKEGKSKAIVDPSINETDGSIFSQSRADQNSLDTFINIANQCLMETQKERPTIKEVIKELEKALNFQNKNQDNYQVLLEDINLATQSFSDSNCIGEGKFWKLYKAEVPQAIFNGKGCTAIVAKRWNKSSQGHQLFYRELEFVFKNKHENVTALVGYCIEMEEKIIVYDHSSKGSLDKYLKDTSLTWMERLKICIDVASGLESFHISCGPEETVMMQVDIKSGSILIDGDRKAKVSNFEIILLEQSNLELSATAAFKQNTESDIYSLGVLLVELLSGRLASEDPSMPLGPLAFREWSSDEMVFEGIKDQIDTLSFSAFTDTVDRCLKHNKSEVGVLVTRLKDALGYQKDIEESRREVLFSDIKLTSDKCIQEGRYWKLYGAQIPHANGLITVYAKWWDNKSRESHNRFFTELRILLKSNDKNVVAFVGYCNNMNKKIILYEYMSNGSLDKHLDDATLDWKKRLNICIDVAKGLQYLHDSDVIEGTITPEDFKSSSILIDGYWRGKIANLECSMRSDDVHWDICTLGVILLEMLCGRLALLKGCEDYSVSLGHMATTHYRENGDLYELVFEDIKEEINLESLTVFQEIAIQCFETWETLVQIRTRDVPKKKEARDVVNQLEKALELQKNLEAIPQLSLEDIKQGTQNFSDDKCVAKGSYWMLYEGEFLDANADGYTTSLVKRWDNKSLEARYDWLAERTALSKYKNNDYIVGIEGYCNEMDEKIIVYEHGYNSSLDKHLDDVSLSWGKRLRICINVALVMHSSHKDAFLYIDVKSDSILIDSDWKGKVSISNLSYWRKEWLAYDDTIDELLVVLLEILRGKLDRGDECESYSKSLKSLAEKHDLYAVARELDESVFEGMKEKIAPESLNLFIKIVSGCLYSTVSWSPEEMVCRLLDACREQEYVEESPQITLKDIKSATHNFGDEKCIGEGRYWKLYQGQFPHANANRHTTALVKRWDCKSSEGRQQFFRQLRIPFWFKKSEIFVAVEGYCSEKDEKIIVFEHAYNRSLDKHLDDANLSWTKRLNICINVASILDLFLQNTQSTCRFKIHGDIKSSSILIDGDWNAKFYNFEFFTRDGEYVGDSQADHNSLGYLNPEDEESGMDKCIHSLGVVLLEILCGRLALPEGCEDHSRSAQRYYKEKGNFDELVFEVIKEQIAPESLIVYQKIALKCIEAEYWQPVAQEIVKQLKNALELQEVYEMYNLPKEYKEYIRMSTSSEAYSAEVKKDLYNMLIKGIPLQQGKLWFTLGVNGERNEMISAMTFSYKNRASRIWQSIPESRFEKVAQMWDISNLKIQIRIKTQFLSPSINYGVYLVFKFYRSRKSRAKREYVNLSYKRGKDNFHAYFATCRDDEWMMIELCRFSSDKKDVDFEAILKSFSRCYCGSRIIYVEGIEFRSIDNVNREKFEKPSSKINEVHQSTIECQGTSTLGYDKEGEKMFNINELNRKKDLRLSPMEFLYDFCNMKPFDSKPSSVSRSQKVEFSSRQVFGIKYKIDSQMLSPDTDYMCYLVFKISEKCKGLHGPVIIRDLLNWKNKEPGILFFKSPSPWNLHDTDWVPTARKRWMDGGDCVEIQLKVYDKK